MNKKVCIGLILFAFVSMVPLLLQSGSYDKVYNSNERSQEFRPVLPVYGPEPRPVEYSEPEMYGPPPPPRKKLNVDSPSPYENDLDVPVVNTVVDGAVLLGDHLVTSYTSKASSMVNRALGKDSAKEQLKADKAMLNNATQVGDDTVGLLSAKDRGEWQRFIDDEFNKDPKAMVEALLPLSQFHPDDVKALSQYIEDKRDASGIRAIVSGAANTPYWEAAQEGIIDQAGKESWANSIEAKRIKERFKDEFIKNAKKTGQALYKKNEKKAEELAQEWFKRYVLRK